jgi:SAM-dependent methyltransferase
VTFQSLRPVESDIAAFYPSDYHPYQAGPVVARIDAEHSLAGPHRKPAWKRWTIAAAERFNRALSRRYPDPLPGILDDVYAPPRPDAVLLDFGCGSADALDRARSRGWTTIGADFLPAVVEAIRHAGHGGYLCDDHLWSALPDASVDLIRMNHVLEHLYNPRQITSQLRRKLRPGGRLHIATPNADSLTFRCLRERWFSLDCPRHIVIFNPRAARRLLLDAGFSRVDLHQEVLTKDMARSLGYWLSDRRKTPSTDVMGMMHRPGLANILFAPARFAARSWKADRFHAIATA